MCFPPCYESDFFLDVWQVFWLSLDMTPLEILEICLTRAEISIFARTLWKWKNAPHNVSQWWRFLKRSVELKQMRVRCFLSTPQKFAIIQNRHHCGETVSRKFPPGVFLRNMGPFGGGWTHLPVMSIFFLTSACSLHWFSSTFSSCVHFFLWNPYFVFTWLPPAYFAGYPLIVSWI